MRIFSPLVCRTTSAVTLAPLSIGFPVCTCFPSLASSTWSNVTLLPASAASSGIWIVAPGSARNCRPPVAKMAYVVGRGTYTGTSMWSSDGVLLRHVAPRRLGHHPELVEPDHRGVAHLELEPRLLLELP